MKRLLKIVLSIFFVPIVLSLIALISGNKYLFSVIRHNFPGIDDYKIFSNRKISKSPRPQPWKIAKEYNKSSLSSRLRRKLEQLQSIAFLVIKNDTILYEEYWNGYDNNQISNSFSMAKTYVGVMTGIALKNGFLNSLDQPVSEFIKDFGKDERKKITIRHLITMSSGLNWKESYINPFSVTTKGYYGDDIIKTCLRLHCIEEPGQLFEYRSGDTQLLAMVLEKATGMNLSQNVEKYLWQPTGTEFDAFWSLDKAKGTEKAYCCLNSNARDFARLGKLYIQNGVWNGQQLLDPGFIKDSITAAPLIDKLTGHKIDFYGYSWWLVPQYKNHRIFYARGILGQYLIVIPEKEMVVVRLGKKRGRKTGPHFEELFLMIDEVLEKW